jgi:hypothetical protein
MTDFAYDRPLRGEPMPGVIAIGANLPVGRAIEEIVILVECSTEDEWESQVVAVP